MGSAWLISFLPYNIMSYQNTRIRKFITISVSVFLLLLCLSPLMDPAHRKIDSISEFYHKEVAASPTSPPPIGPRSTSDYLEETAQNRPSSPPPIQAKDPSDRAIRPTSPPPISENDRTTEAGQATGPTSPPPIRPKDLAQQEGKATPTSPPPLRQKELVTKEARPTSPPPISSPAKSPGQDSVSAESVEKLLQGQYKYIALTFDDGPHTAYDTRILNALNKVQGKATFFMVGSAIPYNAEIVRKIAEQGSEIANHSYNHPDFTGLSAAQIAEQLNLTSNLIAEYSGSYPKYMRVPYGSYNAFVMSQIPYPVILWSLDTQDWLYRDAQYVASQMINAPAGSIILLHSIHPTTAQAVEIALPQMYKAGYRFVTISELLALYGKTVSPYTFYYSVTSP